MKHCLKILTVLLALLMLSGAVAAEELPASEPGQPEATAEQRKLVALTFDDGPDLEMTAPVLDILERYGVRATFFLVGNKINGTSAPLVERAINLGCEIGCHGWDHRKMKEVSKEMNQKQIRQFFAALEEYVHVPVSVMLVRPPGGGTNARVQRAIGELGLADIIWDVDSQDWVKPVKGKSKTDRIFHDVLDHVKDGSIVLMHDRHQTTPDSLENIIPALLEQGYELVTVSELLTRNGDPIEPGVVYKCMPPKEPTALD